MPITPPEERMIFYNNDAQHFLHVLEWLFKPALDNAGFDTVPPVSQGSGIIHADIISNLESSDLVLCDMSIASPNVFFELGIRTALNKPVCLVKDNYGDNVPFDTNLINYHTYSPSLVVWDNNEEITKLQKHIEVCFKKSVNHNSLWKFFGFTSIASSPQRLSKEDEKFEYLIILMEGLRKQLSEQQKTTSTTQEERGKAALISNEIASIALDTQKFNKEIQRDAFNALSKIENSSEEISNKIAKKLIDDPSWVEKFTDESGTSYLGSVFGDRMGHFQYEKKDLAKKVIDILEEEMLANREMKYCLLIDSGTTMFSIFCEICERVLKESNPKKGDFEKFCTWNNRVFIITNNLPGVQYLMKHCKDKSDEYSDLFIKCLLLPGEPLPVYAAVTGPETSNCLQAKYIRKTIREKLEVTKDEEYKIISFIASNYMVRHPSQRNDIGDSYCPVARGGGHFELKTEFAKLSEKIYLISPLTKFSFATCEQLNYLNGFDIDEIDNPKGAKYNPDKVMYREIDLSNEEYKRKCTYFITDREKTDLFLGFAQKLKKELIKSYGSDKVIIATDFKIEKFITVDKSNDSYRDFEIVKEIPHKSLRDTYQEMKEHGHFIWDQSWISNPRKRLDK